MTNYGNTLVSVSVLKELNSLGKTINYTYYDFDYIKS